MRSSSVPLSVSKFKTEREVLELANNADVGLASYVHTDNLPAAWRMAGALQSKLRKTFQAITNFHF
jgi:acyl-CoA reductase-like NAD-dependent aldehyde dehydrogenase